MRRQVFLFLVILVLVPLSFMPKPQIVAAQSESAPSRTDLDGINVAVYLDEGALASSAFALINMFEWMNATAEYIDAEEIQADALDNYDIVAFPGGSTYHYNLQLEALGRTKIKDFVANGGSYFGICGGSMLGTHTTGLGLFNGFYSGSIWGTDIYLMDLAVNRTSTGPDLSEEPENYSTMYWGSAYFYGDGMSEAIPVMTYPDSGRPAMLTCRYELGTVFLSSPHPEYEEGDERDGTSFCDELNDPDSEWGLLLKVSIWLIETAETESTETTTTTTTTTTTITTDGFPNLAPFILGASFIGVAFAASIVFLWSRRIGKS
ncbi:MAG: hypothetical protein EAX95_12465 [Candidatus Thorarchaeota archaeon]|nr:hypothetical protein [Candidatus Thorarchaeota archaeon]